MVKPNDPTGLIPDNLIWLYFEEYYFYIPLVVADFFNLNRFFKDADLWLQLLYNPFLPIDERIIYQGLKNGRDSGYNYRISIAWQLDPFNPFAIASTRLGALLRHTIHRYVEDLLDWADAEFSRDTSESINRARELFEIAQDILQKKDIPQDVCGDAWRYLVDEIYETHTSTEIRLLQLLLEPLQTRNGRVKLSDIHNIGKILRKKEPFDKRLLEVKQYVDQIMKRTVHTKTFSEIRREQEEYEGKELSWEDKYCEILSKERRYVYGYYDIANPNNVPQSPEVDVAEQLSLKIDSGSFCVPFNPILSIMRWRIESNLEKIATCRNYAGMRRSLQTYAAPVDPKAAVLAAAAGEDIESLIPSEPPPIHRFSYLIERARYYVSMAQQLENLLLQSYEKVDIERYNLLKAKQDLKVADANLALQALIIQEANDNIELAKLQEDRAVFQYQHFLDLLNAGLNEFEIAALQLMVASAGMYIIAATFGIVFKQLEAFQATAAALGTTASISSTFAAYERRKEEWLFQRDMAGKDIKIGEQGVKLAGDKLTITEKQRDIGQLQSGFASEVVNFLGAKFTNKELYEWMARLLRRYYREHLNFATVTARMAQRALAFERQETITIIASQYSEREKKDLLSAEQLLTDINRLDQHRLVTEKRRKELTKVISLASVAPVELEQLRKEGWMEFVSIMDWFDQDFPGHYMRLIKNVSMTIVALIPSGESIHATLSNIGISTVVVDPSKQSSIIMRNPESIAVSAASNGTGLFELQLDDPILLPFESSGVESTWTLEMPKGANHFDYETFVDVLFTIRYTALEDWGYRQKVLKRMGIDKEGRVTIERAMPFSFRNFFPDQWYHLSNPVFLADPSQYGFNTGQVNPPYEVQFELKCKDFPPNESIDSMIRLNLVFSQERFVKVPVELKFCPDGTTDEYSVQVDFNWDISQNKGDPISLISFTHLNGNPIITLLSTLKPFGRWRLKIRTEVDQGVYSELFKGSAIVGKQIKLDLSWLKDVLLVITYQAKVEYKYAE